MKGVRFKMKKNSNNLKQKVVYIHTNLDERKNNFFHKRGLNTTRITFFITTNLVEFFFVRQ